MSKVREFPSIVKLVDEGLQKEIDLEVEKWNTREGLERYPLSPSQIGKCGLALARNVAHADGVADYPRSRNSITPRVQRIFARGHALEAALLGDFERLTPLKVILQQTRVTLFTVTAPGRSQDIGGNIDGLIISEVDGVKILTDIKSKGAFYSAGFNDSITQFFQEMRATGLVEELHEHTYLITDVKALFDIISLDEFFVDYLLQLNAYAYALKNDPNLPTPDFVALYYENKNTCQNYEVRWVPHPALFEYARAKFQYIYETVHTQGPEAVAKEFSLGSSRCRLCDHNERCWGKWNPPLKEGRVTGTLDESLDRAMRAAQREHHVVRKVEEAVLLEMEQKGLTHITTSDGITYERKYLKSPKPHFELRLSK